MIPTSIPRRPPIGWARAARGVAVGCLAVLVMAGLYAVSRYSYALFHTLAELISIAIGWSLFTLMWNSRRWMGDDYLYLLGVAFACAAGIDLVHTLAYKGVNVFAGYDSNLPTQLWIAARYLQSLSMLLAVLFLGRRFLPQRRQLFQQGVAIVYLAVAAGLLALIFARVFPTCYVEGAGLTPFKIASEYIICLILLVSLAVLWVRRRHLDRRLLRIMTAATIATIIAELAFTFYVGVYDLSNLAGHYFKIAAYLLLYFAIVQAGLQHPFDLVFRDLAHSVEELRLLFDLLPVGVSVVDADRKNTFVNPAAERILGESLDRMRGGAFDNLPRIRPDGSPLPASEWPTARALLGREAVHDAEVGLVRRDGSTTWVNVSAVPVSLANWRAIIVATDITRRRQAEEALRRSEARFRSYFDLPLAGLAIVSPQKGWIEENDRLCDLLGYSRAELARRTWDELTHPDDLAADIAQFNRVLAGEIDGYTLDKRFIRQDGQIVHVSMAARCVRKGDGTVDYFVALLQDITDRKHIEDDLRRSNADLEQFAYAASHDLQEPLRAVSGMMQLLQQRYRGQLDERANQYISYAVDGAERMQTLITDLLAFARVDRQGKPFTRASAGAALQAALDNLAVAVQDSGAAVTCDDPLPDVLADPTQLVQLLQNLVGNAIKFRAGRPPAVHVGARCLPGKGEWLFSVRDNGIGIEPQYFDRIFAVFQRLHTQREYPGTGIGLAICKKIVERHGGRIWVESQPGAGSTFFFTLPQLETAHDA